MNNLVFPHTIVGGNKRGVNKITLYFQVSSSDGPDIVLNLSF
jgi:hypothetical protein